MKKVFIVVIASCLLFFTSATTFAENSDYDAALRYYYTGKYSKAADYLKGYVEKEPDPAAYYLLGYSLYKLGRFKEANEYFDEAYLIDPNFSPEKSGLGERFPKDKPKMKKGIRRHKAHPATKQRKQTGKSGSQPREGAF